jgi:serine/threonine-protein kinase
MAAAAAIALLLGAIGTAIFAIQAERARALAVSNERAMRREAALSAQSARFMKDMLSGVRPAVAAGRDRAMLRGILDQTAQRIENGELSEYPRVEADIRSTIGAAYKDIGALDRAAAMLEGALSALDRADEPQPLLLGTLLDQLGTVRQDQGRHTEAESHYHRALVTLTGLAGPQPDVDDQIHRVTGNLASLRRQQGKSDEAERLLREVLAWSIQRYGPLDPKVATYEHNLGGALADLQKFPEAEQHYRAALAILRAAHGDTHPYIATASENLGNVLMWQQKFDQADGFLTDAVRIHLASQGENDLLVARARSNLADLRRRQDRPAEAADLYSSALNGFLRSLPPSHVYVCETRMSLAFCMAAQRDFAGAEPVMLEGYQALTANPEIPDALKRTANSEIVIFYERWNAAAPSDETAAKLAQWRDRLRPAGNP